MTARPTMRARPLLALLLPAALGLLPSPAGAADYLATVANGAALLDKGRWNQAIQLFRQAREMDLNDPLAAAGLAYALESDGETASGVGELSAALQLDANSKAALWADALSAVNTSRLDVARQRLDTLREKAGESADAWICTAYVRCAQGDYAGALEALGHVGDPEDVATALSPSERAVAELIAGAAAYAKGDYAAAAKALKASAGNLPPVSFMERIQLRRAPILPEARSSRVEPVPLVSGGSIGPRVRTVTGSIRLYLDPFRVPGATYASFYIDGECLHTTNVLPLYFDWNSRKVRNGYHKIVIRGASSSGQVLGQTEEVVLVRNEGALSISQYPPEAYARTEKALRSAMVLQPDVLATHYLLGLSLARLKDTEGAAASLEIVMGFDPDFGRARKELQAIYAARNAPRVRSVSFVPTGTRKIALTFDDGPNPLYTPPLLDILDHYKAHCTMFLVGSQAEAYPDIVREMVEKGHEIADHTYSHPNLKTLDARSVEMELLRCRSVLRRIAGRAPELFRPPGGNIDGEVGDICASYGFTTVYWDVFDSWLQQYDEQTVLTKLVNAIKPGAIVLLHNGNNKTARIVEPLVEELAREGYQMVTVSELLASATPGAVAPVNVHEAPELRDDDANVPAAPAGKAAPGQHGAAPPAKPGKRIGARPHPPARRTIKTKARRHKATKARGR